MDRPNQPVTLVDEVDRLKRRRRRRLVWGLAVVIVVVCVWLWLKTPATGWVNNSAASTLAGAEASGETAISGRYISFKYPAFLTIKKHEKDEKKGLENIFLHRESQTAATNYSVAVTVMPISGVLNEVSAVQLRRQDPTVYKEEPFTIHSGILFVKQSNGYEKTLIWQEKNHTYSVSLSVPIKGPSADEMFIQIMKSVQTYP